MNNNNAVDENDPSRIRIESVDVDLEYTFFQPESEISASHSHIKAIQESARCSEDNRVSALAEIASRYCQKLAHCDKLPIDVDDAAMHFHVRDRYRKYAAPGMLLRERPLNDVNSLTEYALRGLKIEEMKRLLEDYKCCKQMQFIAQKRGQIADFCDAAVKANAILKKIADLSPLYNPQVEIRLQYLYSVVETGSVNLHTKALFLAGLIEEETR